MVALGYAINVDTVKRFLMEAPIKRATSKKYRGSEVMPKAIIPVKSLVAFFEYFMPAEDQYPEPEIRWPPQWEKRNYRGTFFLRQFIPRLQMVGLQGLRNKYVWSLPVHSIWLCRDPGKQLHRKLNFRVLHS